MKKGYTQDTIFAVIFESERERKRRRMQAIVTETVNAHRLKNMKEFLAYEKLATWRRMNDFDRIAADDNQWASRPPPPTPQEYHASLRHELQKLKDAISIPNDEFARPKRPVEKRGREDEETRQKTMGVVDGRRSDSLDELLANFEFARIAEYVEKRNRQDTVQHSSPCSPDPEPSSRLYVKLENNEGKMGPELDELEPPSAGTGLERPGQQCPPNEGIWETGRTTASGILTAGVGLSQRENISSPTMKSVDKRAKDTKTIEDISSIAATPENRRRKTPSEQNKQFDPGEKGEKAPPWNAAVTLLSFSGESWEAICLFFACALSVLCVCSVS